jgi:ribonuclease HII
LSTRNRSVQAVEGDRFFYEKDAASAGYSLIAGIDEAGRGPLAGPVVASAVVVKNAGFTERIDDSKKLSPAKREKALPEIYSFCDVGIGISSVEEIDRHNIFNATLLAMRRAVRKLPRTPDFLLIDGKMNVDLPQPRQYLTSGESKSLSIACASIVAKVFRDRMMCDADADFPAYGFRKHKGYGTKAHMEAIRRHGLCLFHRKSFGPFGGKK